MKYNALTSALLKGLVPVAGSKGGEAPRQAVESPDSLHSIANARIVDLVSEGEIEGPVHGSSGWLQDIALDETPVQNADGSLNFSHFFVDSRKGTQTQKYIQGFPAVENELAINFELKQAIPWTRSFTNLSLSAIRVRLGLTNGLSQTSTTTGDITGSTVTYAIDLATDGGSFVNVLTAEFNGKASGPTERSHRIELPDATVSGWIVRVRRITADSATAYLVNATYVASATEVIDGKFRYPMSAIFGLQFDAKQFTSIPSRAYHLKGRKIQVPVNYNPTTRAYTGVWNGTFKNAYSNNPAWVFYDIITNKRYGLGNLLSYLTVDKWELYAIGQYCDEYVPDGFGGTEPRMTSNIFLQRSGDAYKVVSDIASVFRGMCYWAAGSIVPVSDRPQDPVYTYTNANVVEGVFRYEGSGRRARHTAVLVSYNDNDDYSRLKTDYYDNPDGIARYGYQLAEVVAIGSTSRGQAQRVARWILLSEQLLTNCVAFSVGLEGVRALPGQIIRVADKHRAGRRMGGRISAGTTANVTVDRVDPLKVPKIGDSITVINNQGVSETRVIGAVAGTVITPSVPFSTAPAPQSSWAVDSNDLSTQLFRVLSIVDSTPGVYSLYCLQHNASIYDAVDLGTPISIPAITKLPSGFQLKPASVTITSTERAGLTLTMPLLTAKWPPTAGAVKYRVQWRKDKGQWTPAQTVHSRTTDYGSPFPGVWECRVSAINANGVQSGARYSDPYTLVDQSLLPTSVQDASDLAAAAAADAAAAMAEINAQASDNILSKVEKKATITNYNTIINDKAGIDAEATNLGITTEKTNYDNAIASATGLTVYLNSLSPAWNDQTQNTPIVGSTYKAKWNAVYSTRQILLNKIYNVQKALSDTAQSTANAASTAANAAAADLSNMASDNVLSVVEKKRVINDWNVVAAEKAGISAQAVKYDLEDDLTAYNAAYSALASYLGTLTSPVAWNNLTNITNVVGTTFRSKWADYYQAKVTILQHIADVVMYGPDYTPGENLVPNPSFNFNRLGMSTGQYKAVNTALCDGWWVYPTSGGIAQTAENGIIWNGTQMRCRIYGQTPLAAGGTRFNAFWGPKIPVQAGKTYEFGYGCTNSYNGSLGANLDVRSRIAVHWYDSAGAAVGSWTGVFSSSDSGSNRASGIYKGTAKAPAGAMFMRPDFGAAVTNNGATSYTHATSILFDAGFDNVWVRKLEDLQIPGSGYQIGDQRNLVPTRTGSTGSRWSGAGITFSFPTTGSPAVVTFNVAAGSLVAGSASIPYNASSNTVNQARSTTVTYYLYYIDADYAGGAKTLNITTNAANISNADDRMWIGDAVVTTPALGTGGSGGGGGGGSCVENTMWIDKYYQAKDVEPGDVIDIIGDDEMVPMRKKHEVTANVLRITDCYRMKTASGAEVIAGATTPMTLITMETKLFPEMLGEMVLVDHLGQLRWEEVVELDYVGLRPVCHISVGGNSYFSGTDPDHRIATHNSLKP
jgi:predicted phage tail protein